MFSAVSIDAAAGEWGRYAFLFGPHGSAAGTLTALFIEKTDKLFMLPTVSLTQTWICGFDTKTASLTQAALLSQPDCVAKNKRVGQFRLARSYGVYFQAQQTTAPALPPLALKQAKTITVFYDPDAFAPESALGVKIQALALGMKVILYRTTVPSNSNTQWTTDIAMTLALAAAEVDADVVCLIVSLVVPLRDFLLALKAIIICLAH